MSDLAPRLAGMPEGLERAALSLEMTETRARARRFALAVLVLQMIALTCMAIGHYI